ncbi:MAG: DUF5716 family protein [Clostridiales bacterium]|nr:DUF5716 family protein [Clostridiales bacterium]
MRGGGELCYEYTQIGSMSEEKPRMIPTVICKCKDEDTWYIGEEAYAHNLAGDGILVDQLVSQLLKDGTATLGGIRYEGRDLLKRFLREAVTQALRERGETRLTGMVYAVRKLTPKLVEILMECAGELGVEEQHVRVISHAESFVYYIMSQKKEIWCGTVGMFDLSEERLRYYELKVQRGSRQPTVRCEYENLEEGSISLDILDTPSGAKLADKILCACGERMMQKKLYSSVFLTGRGFENRDWAEGFMKLLCVKRRVYLETAVFAKGAFYRAQDLFRDQTAYPYTILCDGRLQSTVSMSVLRRGQETSIILAAAGDDWYGRETVLDVIPDHQDTVDLVVTADTKNKRTVSIPLTGFPKREERTVKVRIRLSFAYELTMKLDLKDQGFGELFPATGAQVKQEVMI